MDLNISIEDAFQNASEHVSNIAFNLIKAVNNPRGKPRGIIRISSTGRSYVKLDILPFCLGS